MEGTELTSSSDALFPAPLLSDPEPASLVEPLIQQLRQIMKRVHELPHRSTEFDAAKEASIAELRQVIQHLHLRFAGPVDQSLCRRIGEARQQARLPVEHVARLSGVSARQISRVESDDPAENAKVSQNALMALCAVPELHLIPKELLKMPRYEDSTEDRANFIVTSGFDALAMHHEMKRILRSSGGTLEQSLVYMEHESANDWLELCNSPGYVAMGRQAFPHREAAKCLAQRVGKAGIDFVMLGPGDGKTEVSFAQHVLAETEHSAVRMYLIEASQPLLNKAYSHAVETLGREPRVSLWPMQGSFLQLARYKAVNASPHTMHRRRVYTMFGNTLANIDNEVSFLRSAFSGAYGGDLLIFDMAHAFTTAVHDSAKIKAMDPVFSAPIPAAFDKWLGGPVRRHFLSAKSIELFIRPDADRPISGSYGFQIVASVQERDDQHREFVLFNFRRYDIEKLSTIIQRTGWSELGRFAFHSTAHPRSLLMFQKQ